MVDMLSSLYDQHWMVDYLVGTRYKVHIECPSNDKRFALVEDPGYFVALVLE